MLCKILSLAGKSTILLWILISYLSKVAVPPPSGPFLAVTLSLLVGTGIGPEIGMPAPLAIVFILSITAFNLSISTLCNLIRTVVII